MLNILYVRKNKRIEKENKYWKDERNEREIKKRDNSNKFKFKKIKLIKSNKKQKIHLK